MQSQASSYYPSDTRHTALYADDDASIYSYRTSYSQAYHTGIFNDIDSHPSALPLTEAFFSAGSPLAQSGTDTSRPDSEIDPYKLHTNENDAQRTKLPQVVVWSPLADNQNLHRQYEDAYDSDPSSRNSQQSVDRQQRTPSAMPSHKINFSRPYRQLEPPFSELDAHKHEVLERNAFRNRHPARPSYYYSSMSTSSGASGSPVRNYNTSPNTTMIRSYQSPLSSHALDPKSLAFDAGHDPPMSTGLDNISYNFSDPIPSQATQYELSSQQTLSPSRTPSAAHMERSSTPESLYSDYSYYQLESPSPGTENVSSFHSDDHKTISSQDSYSVSRRLSRVMQAVMPESSTTLAQSPSYNLSPQSAQFSPTPLPSCPTTPSDYLHLGITHHESNRLNDSAHYFEKAATLNGGCVIGMLMWGLSLRHGWGCTVDEKSGFKWLQKAAEHALGDLEASGKGKVEDRGALKTELVLAVYEVGQCFFRGWGVRRDKKMGFSYFQTAAQMGDPDAQQDLAFCLANGKGCKKDRKAAAKWYRAAIEQGASTVGLAWIYKPKYME